MRYSYEELEEIAEKTDFECHLCHQEIEFDKYGNSRHPGGWEVDHLRPRSKNGHSGFTNLFAAHCSCNRKKGNRSNRRIRSYFGVIGIPLSLTARIWRGLGWAALIVLAGFLFWTIFLRKNTSEGILSTKPA